MVEGASIPARAVDPTAATAAEGRPAAAPRAAVIPRDPTIPFTQETRIRNTIADTTPVNPPMAAIRAPARGAAIMAGPRDAGIDAAPRVAARPT